MKLQLAIIIGVILTISGLMVISPAIAAPNENAKGGPPELEKIVFIHFEKPNHLSDPDCDPDCEGRDKNKTFQLVFGGLKWSSLPIEYKINESQFSSTSEQDAIKDSAETWDEVLGDTIDLFDFKGSTPIIQADLDAQVAPDYENVIIKGNLASGTIAVTSFWYNPATNEVLDTDMILNDAVVGGDYSWSTHPPGVDNLMDVQNIVTHEFGHFLILNDLYRPPTSALTMYGYSATGEINARTLGVGDELGDLELYGIPVVIDEGGPKSCEDFNPNHPRYCGP